MLMKFGLNTLTCPAQSVMETPASPITRPELERPGCQIVKGTETVSNFIVNVQGRWTRTSSFLQIKVINISCDFLQ